MSPKKTLCCDHSTLVFTPSSHASSVGFKHTNLTQRIAATTPRGTVNSEASEDEQSEAAIFPGPLVLPEDELAWVPKYPPQSLRSWTQGIHRNKVTPERRTIYFTGPPGVDPGLDYIQQWTKPRVRRGLKEKAVGFPPTSDVLDYLEAFYHGLPVKILPSPKICFTADIDDEDSPPKKRAKKANMKARETKSKPLWLNINSYSGCIGIRSRATPKGDFSHQLNLNDLLDTAMEILPDDAYALLMLVEHDIYEDEDDDFACGRAYGGSRIAVVSGARYNPILDSSQRVERDHAWPASHCEKYMQSCCDAVADEDEDAEMGDVDFNAGSASDSIHRSDDSVTPMQAALSAHLSLASVDCTPSATALSGMWLGRICRTASHELGHCFGIDHCVYYACAMQGTASIIEDARQPPYLCPIDLAKILSATGADQIERYKALLEFCERYKEAQLFAAYGSWIRGRLEMLSS